MPTIAQLKPYFSPRIGLIFVMGIASGLPLLLTASTLAYWLVSEGLTLSQIGLAGLLAIPYSLKFLWAPMLDHFQLPYLTKCLGQRKSWLFVCQILLGICMLALGFFDPKLQMDFVGISVFGLALFSASQDIIIDAYRIEYLRKDEQSLGAGATQLGYRVGCIIAGAGALSASDFVSWSFIYSVLATIIFAAALLTLFIPESHQKTENLESEGTGAASSQVKTPNSLLLLQQQFVKCFIEPLTEFLKRPQAILIIFFILIYKLPDTYIGFMVMPFLKQMAFTGSEIALITKVWGVFATSVGTIFGAIYCDRYGLFKGLLLGGILLACTNLAYLWVFYFPTVLNLGIAISIENLAAGFSNSAFVILLSLLCNQSYTATQYALFSSLMSVARVTLAPVSGNMAEILPWNWFFISSMPLILPGLIILFCLKKKFYAIDPSYKK